ncbi:MAG: two-component regulator propeller domain-containing protein, partial [Pseudomonadota bacterium]
VEFKSFTQARDGLPSSRITALAIGRNNKLWIGTEAGHLVLFDRGVFRVVVPPPHPGHAIAAIVEDRAGDVWFLHPLFSQRRRSAWLWQWTGGTLKPRRDLEARLLDGAPDILNAMDSPGGITSTFPSLALDDNGSALARMRGGRVLRLDDEGRDWFDGNPESIHFLGSAQLTAQIDGALIGLRSSIGQLVARLPNSADRARAVWLRDRRGYTWTSTANSIDVFSPSAATPMGSWSVQPRVLDLIEDREGNIWVATRLEGLLRIQPSAVQEWGLSAGVPLPNVLREEPDGSAVMSIQLVQQDPSFIEPRRAYRIPLDGGLPEPENVYWQRTDSQGRFWLFGEDGLVGESLSGHSFFLPEILDQFVEDPNDPNLFWADTHSSVIRLRVVDERELVIEDAWPIVVRSPLRFDAEGALLVGAEDGFHRLSDSGHQAFKQAEGLPVSEVRGLQAGSRGDWWLGTYGGGLVNFDGTKFSVISRAQGLVEDFISAVVSDEHGALWLAGTRGIQRVLVSDLYAFLGGQALNVPSELFAQAHGMSNPEAVGPSAGVRVADRLYFSTFGGLVVIDPSVIAAREGGPLDVYVMNRTSESLINDNEPLLLAPDEQTLTLNVRPIHLSAPETLRFRHRLPGLHDDWIEQTPPNRLVYSGLNPGQHKLEVQARHSGGPWVSAATVPTINVLPQWWERRLVQSLLVGLMLIALTAVWLGANRRLRDRARRLELAVADRTRSLAIERDRVAQQAAQLKELAEGRARFIAGISHELRTPLTLIRGPLDALAE